MRFRFSFGVKLALALSLLSVSTTTIGVYLFYVRTQQLVVRQITERLITVGRTASLQFDDEAIAQIQRLKAISERESMPITKEVLSLSSGETMASLSSETADRLMATSDFQQLVQRLRKIGEASRPQQSPPQIFYPQPSLGDRENPIEILTYLQVKVPESPDARIVKFIASSMYEAEGNWEGNPIGTLYGNSAPESNIIDNQFGEQPVTAQEFFHDDWGVWLWAIVPILDRQGNVIAAIGLDYNATSEANEIRQLQYLCWSIIALSFMLSVVVALVIARRLNRPIAQLQTAALQVRDRNFNVAIDLPRNDEFGLLAGVFNQMVSEIRSYAVTLEAKNQSLETQVQQRTIELQEKADQLSQTLDELRRTQSQMIHNEKMLSLGQLVAGVAHEINNPVNFISGNLNHAKTYLEDVTQLIRLYQQHYPNSIEPIQIHQDAIDLEYLMKDFPQLFVSMQTGADRIKQIVLALRNFSRMDEAALKTVNLYEGLESTLVILKNRLNLSRGTIAIVKQYVELPAIECYAGELNQVFLSILNNAIDAIEEKLQSGSVFNPTIRISTRIIDRNQIVICISDNGIGMKESVRQRIFDPFFTTRPVGQGTGLGMAIAHQIIVQKHSGSIEVRSIVGQGSELAIALPVLQTQKMLVAI